MTVKAALQQSQNWNHYYIIEIIILPKVGFKIWFMESILFRNGEMNNTLYGYFSILIQKLNFCERFAKNTTIALNHALFSCIINFNNFHIYSVPEKYISKLISV